MFMFVYKNLGSYGNEEHVIYDARDIDEAFAIFYSETVDYEHVDLDLFSKIIAPLSVEETVKMYNELAIGHYELITVYTGLTEVFSRRDELFLNDEVE